MSEREILKPSSEAQRETLDAAVTRYAEALTVGPQTYLAARGLAPLTIRTARLGVVANPAPGHSKFEGWLAIPYLNKNDKPVGIRFRCLKEHDHKDLGHGKYMGLEGAPSRVYAVGNVHLADDTIHVAEGELDALILEQLGLPAIGIAGAQAWKPHYRRMLAGFSRVWVWGDPDEAGEKFTNTVLNSLVRAKPVKLEIGDVTSTFLKYGGDHIRSLVGG